MRSGTRVAIGIGAALAAVAVVTYINRAPSERAGLVTTVKGSQRPVRTQVLEPRDVKETVTQTGVLEAARDVMITSEVAGKVEQVAKSLGDRCRHGDPLVQLDAESYRIGLGQAEAGLKQARTQHRQAVRDLERVGKLAERDLASASEQDRAKSAVETAAAQVEQAEAATRMARRNVREATIRCPFPGVVAERHVELGQLVGPQSPLVRLVDTRTLTLTVTVSAAHLSRMRIGQTATLSDPSSPRKTFAGKVVRLGVAADRTTRTFPVEVELTPTDGEPRPGQVVRALVHIADHTGVLAVPEDAVEEAADGPHVYLVEGDVAKRVPVKVGQRVDGAIIVEGGLEAGQRVVVIGREGLRDGDAIVAVDAGGGQPKVVEPRAEAPAEPESQQAQ